MRSSQPSSFVDHIHGSRTGRRALLGAVAASAVLALSMPGIMAGAHSSSSPSPIANFQIGRASSSPTTAIVAPNGTAYLAYSAANKSDFGSAYVCVLPRGARKCSATTLLPPLNRNTSVWNQPDSLLFGPSGAVDVLVTMHNDANGDDKTATGADADTIEYVLKPGGKLVGSPKRIGSLDEQGNAISYKGQILWVSGSTDTGTGAISLQESPADGSATGYKNITSPIRINLAGTPAAKEFYFYGGDVVALHNGHLLIAWDDNTNAYDVEVDPAKGFRVVGSSEFKGFVTTYGPSPLTSELSTGPQGALLLLRSSANGFSGKLVLRKYTSKGHFGAPRSVPSPNSANTDYGDYRLVQQASGVLDVFYEAGSVLVQETSYNGGHSWSKFNYPGPTPFVTQDLATALLPFGAGVVFEASGGTVADGILPKVQPVLVHQSVNLSIVPNPVKVGKQATPSGVVSHAHGGQLVKLQKEVGKSWHTVATVAEKANGYFSFVPIKAQNAGKTTYRVETAEVAGWFFAGFSNTRTLVVYKPKKK
jgi:hypothetical protein